MRMRDVVFFFFNNTATTEIYTLSLHDALPICYQNHVSMFIPTDAGVIVVDPIGQTNAQAPSMLKEAIRTVTPQPVRWLDRKSTRLNSSHANTSYAVFCLKQKQSDAVFFVWRLL